MIVIAAYGWAPMIPVLTIVGLGVLNSGLRAVYIKRAGRPINYKSFAMEHVVGYIAYLIGFATAGMEVRYFYWVFMPVMALVVAHDAKRMLADPIEPEGDKAHP
jgi:hypothetical protein